MKKLLSLATLVGLLAGCTTAFDVDMRPEASKDTTPTAVVWSNANDTSLAAATSELVIAGIPSSATSAQALLGQLKGAYATDPYVLTQIGAVSQYVMRPGQEATRRTWTAALLKTAEEAKDTYVKMACLDQLRWCGDADAVPRIRVIGAKGEKSVKDFADMVIRELTGKSIGL